MANSSKGRRFEGLATQEDAIISYDTQNEGLERHRRKHKLYVHWSNMQPEETWRRKLLQDLERTEHRKVNETQQLSTDLLMQLQDC